MEDKLTDTPEGGLPEATSDTVETTPVSGNDVEDIIKNILDSQNIGDQTTDEPDEEDDKDEALTEEDDEEIPELQDSDEGEPELEDDPDGLDARFTIDSSILDSLGDNEKAKSRLEQQVKGWKKLAERYDKEDVQKLVKNKDYLLALHDNFQMARSEPQRFLAEYDKFLQQNTGFGIVDYIPEDNGISDTTERAKPNVNIDELVERRIAEKLKPYEAEMASKQKSKEMESYLDKAYPLAHEHLKKTCRGWEVTREMVKTAVEGIPSLKNKPSEAVKRWFGDDLAKHYVKAQENHKSAPDMVQTAGRKKDSQIELKSGERNDVIDYVSALIKNVT